MKLGTVIKGYMWANHITGRELAKELGLDHTLLHRFINGENTSSTALAKILTWLLSEEKESQTTNDKGTKGEV